MGARYLTLLLLVGCGPIGKTIAPPPGAATVAGAPDDTLLRTHVITGWAKDAAGDAAGARAAFNEAVRLDPGSVDAHIARGRFLAPVDPDAARNDLKVAVAKDSSRADAWGALASLGDSDAAARAIGLHEPEAWAAGWNGTSAYAQDWAKIPLRTPAQYLARAKARAQVSDHDGAVTDALAALPTETDGAASILAGSAIEAKRVGAALDALLDETPQTELARTALRTLARAADDPVRTLQALPYMPVSGTSDDAWLLMEVDSLRRCGRYDEAIARADKALDTHKGWAEMLRRKAQAQLDAGKPRAAAETMAEPIIGAWTPIHTLLQARALARSGRGEEALRVVEADQWRDSDSAQMAYALVIAGSAAAKATPTKGQDAMNRGAARLPAAVRADAYEEAGLIDKALEGLSEDDPAQVERAGRMLLQAGRIQEAMDRLDAGTLRWPERVRLWTLLGKARGRDMEFQVARGLAPQDPDAILWFARKGDFSVEPDLLRALEADPGNATLFWARGALELARGMPMRAVVSYEAALARSPADTELRAALADVYTSLGDPVAAARSNPKVEAEADDAPRVRKHDRVRSKKSGKSAKSHKGSGKSSKKSSGKKSGGKHGKSKKHR